VKGVAVDNGTVRVDFTPTFMGCPALEVMQRAMEATIAELGATPDIRVRLDDSWSTDDITAEGREKLRVAGFAPPTPRPAERLELVQLQRGFAARTAARRKRSSRTCSARRRAGRFATATSAASRSSSSRRSD
jgi:ring-1,2-phenylacetyl-CoA epoxidase subunit PaaD